MNTKLEGYEDYWYEKGDFVVEKQHSNHECLNLRCLSEGSIYNIEEPRKQNENMNVSRRGEKVHIN